jgi:hypothetical protein
LFKDYLKGNIPSPYVLDPAWLGSKRTRKIEKAAETELDIVDRWMRTNPAGKVANLLAK